MPGETVWVSGGQLLSPISWKQHDLSGGKNIWAADLSAFDLAKVPGPSSFALLRPYLAHFLPVFSRFLRVFTVSTRRFQRAPSRSPGPRDRGKSAQTPFLRPS